MVVNPIVVPSIDGADRAAVITAARADDNIPAGTYKAGLQPNDGEFALMVFDNFGKGFSSPAEALAAILEFLYSNIQKSSEAHADWLELAKIFLPEGTPDIVVS